MSKRRPSRSLLKSCGQETGLCCHPYPLCTELIACEAGILVSDENVFPLRSELNLSAEVSWVGYANNHIPSCIEPLLQKAAKDHGFFFHAASRTTSTADAASVKQDISSLLAISEWTVKFHVSNILSKLQVSDRRALSPDKLALKTFASDLFA